MTARDQKLVDAAFVGGLSANERDRMHDALAGSIELQERYRKLQLAERVASLGPERALDEPSPFEIDRVAQRLGLLDAPAPRRRWFGSWKMALPMVVAAAAAALVLAPRSDESSASDPGALVARGGEATPSISVYRTSSKSGFELVGDSVTRDAQLILRSSAGETTTQWRAVWQFADGNTEILKLPAPAKNGLLGPPLLPPAGAVKLWLIAGDEVDDVKPWTGTGVGAAFVHQVQIETPSP